MFQPLLIASFNTHWACGADGVVDTSRIAKAISANGAPEVICLQEVSVGPTGLEGLAHGPNQVAEYLALFPEYTAYFAPTLSRSQEGRPAHFGNLTLTRLPVGQVRYHSLPSPTPEPGTEAQPCNAIATTLSHGELSFTVLNTHLEYRSRRQRMAQIAYLRTVCDQLIRNGRQGHEISASQGAETSSIFSARPAAGPVVLCGDLNCTPDSEEIGLLCNGVEGLPHTLSNVWLLHDHATQATHTVGLHTEYNWPDHPYCCDHFVVSEQLIPNLVESWVDQTATCSDHQPIFLRLNAGSHDEPPVFL